MATKIEETEELDELRRRALRTTEEYTFIRGAEVPVYFKKFEEAIEDFEIYEDDVWVITFPKAGTTWTQEMVWCIKNDLDFEKAKDKLPDRFPFFEVGAILDWEKEEHVEHSVFHSVEFTKNFPRPRFIKTHLPFNLLPRQLRTFAKKPKIIYVTRNSKDSCISFYHHYRLFRRFFGTFEEFCKLFMSDRLGFGSYWDHKKGFWEHRNQDNILFLRYEEMKENLPAVITKTANFLNKKLNDEQLQLLADHLSFENMKKNPAVNYEEIGAARNPDGEEKATFIRKGQVGQWKEEMPKHFIELFDQKDEKYRKEIGNDF